MQSQCPHCQSIFDIPEAALEAAEGIVRCGQCMQLFDAASHITGEVAAESDPENDLSVDATTLTGETPTEEALAIDESESENKTGQEAYETEPSKPESRHFIQSDSTEDAGQFAQEHLEIPSLIDASNTDTPKEELLTEESIKPEDESAADQAGEELKGQSTGHALYEAAGATTEEQDFRTTVEHLDDIPSLGAYLEGSLENSHEGNAEVSLQENAGESTDANGAGKSLDDRPQDTYSNQADAPADEADKVEADGSSRLTADVDNSDAPLFTLEAEMSALTGEHSDNRELTSLQSVLAERDSLAEANSARSVEVEDHDAPRAESTHDEPQPDDPPFSVLTDESEVEGEPLIAAPYQELVGAEEGAKAGGTSGLKGLLIKGLATAACVTLVGLLALQWFAARGIPETVWGNDDRSPLVSQLCNLIVCQSSGGATGRYKSLDIVVHSHPDSEEALILKTTLVNSSNKPLPYPHLSLEFSSLSNEPVARRVFSPEEYLGDSLLSSGNGLLAQDTPVEIQLELADPGADAVNYSILYFLPAS